MKNKIILLTLTFVLLLTSCVQNSYKQTVHFQVDVKGLKNIKSIGIRGEKPLDWNTNLELKISKDSIYEGTVEFDTGYKFVTYKFTVNGTFELENQDNRKVFFNKNRVTIVKAKINVP